MVCNKKRKPVFIKRKWNHVVFSRVTIFSFHPVFISLRKTKTGHIRIKFISILFWVFIVEWFFVLTELFHIHTHTHTHTQTHRYIYIYIYIYKNLKLIICMCYLETNVNIYIFSECYTIAKKEFKCRHDLLDNVIHWELCKRLKVDPSKNGICLNQNLSRKIITKEIICGLRNKLIISFRLRGKN